MSEPSSAPAGFYTDPNAPSMQRWWDGTAWTDVTRAAPPAGPTASASRAGRLFPIDPRKQTVLFLGNPSPVRNMIISGILLVAVSFMLFITLGSSAKVEDPLPATATVVSVKQSVSSKGATSCAPIVSFTTQDGEKITAISPVYSSGMCGARPGQTYEITYDRTNPTVIAGLDSGAEFWFILFPALFLFIPTLVFVSSLIVLLLRKTSLGKGIPLVEAARRKDLEKLYE